MDTNLITVGKEVFPVKYGFNALRLFCNASNIGLQELEGIAENISIDHAINLVWAGMKDGARTEKKDFDLTTEDVADLIDVDFTVVKQCMDLFVSSFVKPSTEEKK
tara:strand:+ start:1389 stop:1706 length:318 start_codon:yes stop_codon:yes gene_type:complete